MEDHKVGMARSEITTKQLAFKRNWKGDYFIRVAHCSIRVSRPFLASSVQVWGAICLKNPKIEI